MEVAEALISSLYTNFILRDFVGKVVPGGLILFSMAILFSSPAKVVEFIKGSPIVVVALVGVSWTLMLGLQGFADMLGLQRALELTSIWTNLWRPVDESTYVVNLTQFRRSACPDDNLAYERFEVIYQACRNLLFAMIISIFPVAWYLWRKNPSSSVGTKKQCAPAVIWIRAVFLVIFVAISGIGLAYTTSIHVERVKKLLDAVSAKPCPKASQKEGTGRQTPPS